MKDLTYFFKVDHLLDFVLFCMLETNIGKLVIALMLSFLSLGPSVLSIPPAILLSILFLQRFSWNWPISFFQTQNQVLDTNFRLCITEPDDQQWLKIILKKQGFRTFLIEVHHQIRQTLMQNKTAMCSNFLQKLHIWKNPYPRVFVQKQSLRQHLRLPVWFSLVRHACSHID